MGALTLGPIVLSLDRAYAGLAFMVLLVGAEWLSRRGRPDLTGWAWRTAIIAFVGARAGFVLSNLDHYLSDPVAIVAIWQGGFAPWWGVAAAAAWTAWEAWRVPAVRAGGPALGAGALLAWLVPAALLTPSAADLDVRLPAVELRALDGSGVALAEIGRPSVVNVWATWCPPCRRELPLLTATAAGTPDVAVLLVNQGEAATTIERYLAAHGLDGAGVLLDPAGAVGDALRVRGLPTTLAFDAEGRLVDLHVGEISAPALARLVASARSSSASAAP
jgi:cytochrome c biogenesis protein CcmG, thiol:disulfide interchange protein DsbE